MASATPKDHSAVSNYPRALSSIIISAGLLAVFITLASWMLLSHPIGTVIRSYFYSVDQTSDIDSLVSWDKGRVGEVQAVDKPEGVGTERSKSESVAEFGQNRNDRDGGKPGSVVSSEVVSTELPKSEGTIEVGHSQNVGDGEKTSFRVSSGNDTVPQGKENENPKQTHETTSIDDRANVAASAGLPKSEIPQGNANHEDSVDSDCDLYQGKWFYDPAGPVYTNNACPIITQMQNCQGNGRPDKEYESWRWKPSQCELPRFNATKFLELMSGKTIAFVGDSVARNQMESLLCLLWQVEVPKNRGNRHMHRWFFNSKSVMIVRIWSSWLVHQTAEPFSYAPEGVAKLHLDVPDENLMEHVPSFDVVILSSGHWFAKQSVYILNNEIVGTQLWSPPKQEKMKISSVEAFGISVETSVAAMATHPNYTGITIVRSYSPDHYEGGAWNTGGSCTGKEKPVLPGKLVENGFTNSMHEQQVRGFYKGTKNQTNKSKLKLMDITGVFSYRHDGHPGPYRSPDPNKITKRGPDGKPPPQDCLHWCMPGPVDTWNELVLEIIRREYEGNKNAVF